MIERRLGIVPLAALTVPLGLAAGCGGGEPASRVAAAAAERSIVFTDVTEAAGVRFAHDNGASREACCREKGTAGELLVYQRALFLLALCCHEQSHLLKKVIQ